MAGQVWAVNSLGGYFHSENLSNTLRQVVQPMCKFRQFCDIKDASMQGKRKGDIFHWDVYGNVSSQGTTLTETSRMAETNFPVYQGTLTITEAGRIAALVSSFMYKFCSIIIGFNMAIAA